MHMHVSSGHSPCLLSALGGAEQAEHEGYVGVSGRRGSPDNDGTLRACEGEEGRTVRCHSAGMTDLKK